MLVQSAVCVLCSTYTLIATITVLRDMIGPATAGMCRLLSRRASGYLCFLPSSSNSMGTLSSQIIPRAADPIPTAWRLTTPPGLRAGRRFMKRAVYISLRLGRSKVVRPEIPGNLDWIRVAWVQKHLCWWCPR